MKIAKQPKSIELYVKKIKSMNAETVQKYQKRWVWLIKHHGIENMPLSQSFKKVVDKTIASAKKNEIKPSSFRTYKAAICFGLAKCYLQLDDIDPASNLVDEELTKFFISDLYKQIIDVHIQVDKHINFDKKTSSYKKKMFPQQYYQYLMTLYKEGENELNSRFNLLCAFIDANLIVGLRPIEWLGVSFACNINTRTFTAFVKNGKNSQGRANGDIRELLLHEITVNEINKLLIYQLVLEDQISNATLLDRIKADNKEIGHKALNETSTYDETIDFLSSNLPDDFNINEISARRLAGENFYRSLQNEMFRVYQLFLDETNYSDDEYKVSLYSTRHQCIANAKKSDASSYQIAAFFGHSSIHTSRRHYGKPWFGWSKFNFRPSLESVAKVNGGLEYLNSMKAVTDSMPEIKNEIQKVKKEFNLNYHPRN